MKRKRRALGAQRSPIRLQRNLLVERVLKKKAHGWVCDDDRLNTAEFQDRRDPRHTAVLHRTTKPGVGPWQLSYFDEHGAVGDSSAQTCTRALRDLSNKHWRLRKVVNR